MMVNFQRMADEKAERDYRKYKEQRSKEYEETIVPLFDIMRECGFIAFETEDWEPGKIWLYGFQYQLPDGSRLDFVGGYDNVIGVKIIPPDEVKNG